MKNFFKANNSLSLDVSLNGLRIVQVDNTKKGTVITAYGSIELFQDKVEASLETNDNYLEEQLAELLTNHVIGKINSEYIGISIPASKTFVRTITLPRKIEKDLNNAIDLEVEQYIPIPKSMLAIDYEIIERNKNEIKVSLVAVPSNIINRVMNLAKSAGFIPYLIEPSIESIARLLNNNEQGDLNTIIVDIGLSNTDIGILNKTIQATSSIGVGGNDFTLAIAKTIDTTNEEAYQLKVLKGLNKSKHQKAISNAVQPTLNSIEHEIEKIMRYSSDRLNDSKIEQIIITGSGSNLAGIGEYFTNSFYLPVRIANPWENITFKKIVKPKKIIIARYLTVAGLASLNPNEVIK